MSCPMPVCLKMLPPAGRSLTYFHRLRSLLLFSSWWEYHPIKSIQSSTKVLWSCHWISLVGWQNITQNIFFFFLFCQIYIQTNHIFCVFYIQIFTNTRIFFPGHLSKMVFLSHDLQEVKSHILWLQIRHSFSFHLNCELFLTCIYILLLITAPFVPWKNLKPTSYEIWTGYTYLTRIRKDWLLLTFTLMDQCEGNEGVALLLWLL